MRHHGRLAGASGVHPEEELLFLEIKEAVCTRYEQLRLDAGGEVPGGFARGIETLAGVKGVASLAEAELQNLRASVEIADRELEGWIERLERQDRFRANVGRRARRNVLTLVAVPVFFALLVALFVVVGTKFFFSH